MTDGVCRVEQEWQGRTAVLHVAGVVDMLTAPYLEAATTACFGERPIAIILDLTDTEFLASAGIGALIHARTQADDLRMGFSVVADAPATSRPLELLGLHEALNLHTDVDSALATLAGGR